jgi:hypothetical protein
MSRTLWIVAAVLGLLWLFRKPLEQLYQQRVLGLEAAADAAIENRYTTYNTQLYAAPFWKPVLRFFKANSYLPASRSTAASEGGGQQVSYSVQG